MVGASCIAESESEWVVHHAYQKVKVNNWCIMHSRRNSRCLTFRNNCTTLSLSCFSETKVHRLLWCMQRRKSESGSSCRAESESEIG